MEREEETGVGGMWALVQLPPSFRYLELPQPLYRLPHIYLRGSI